MKLWVGLGNPEPSMRFNRHNIGFMAVEKIARHYAFTPWRKRFKGDFAEGQIGGQKIILLRPMTYMNRSGESVQQALAFYKLAPPSVVVFHDELDLPPGKIRVKFGGGAAGHNGLRSIGQLLGDPGYWRVRMGIGHPGDRARVTGHVLGDFSSQDQLWLDALLDNIARSAGLLAEDQGEAFMTKIALLSGG